MSAKLTSQRRISPHEGQEGGSIGPASAAASFGWRNGCASPGEGVDSCRQRSQIGNPRFNEPLKLSWNGLVCFSPIGCWPPWRPHRALAPMNKDAEGRWKVGMSNIKLKMRAHTKVLLLLAAEPTILNSGPLALRGKNTVSHPLRKMRQTFKLDYQGVFGATLGDHPRGRPCSEAGFFNNDSRGRKSRLQSRTR